MLDLIEIIKVIFLGIVEGITEWLPISSTGHMLLVDEFIQIKASDSFKEMFFVVIQLGAIMAVVLLFWNKMFPFEMVALKDKNKSFIKKDIFSIWFKVVVACIPGTAVTLIFGDFIDKYLETPIVIATTLVLYGVIFIIVENWNKKRTAKIDTLNDITYTTALIIGLFQVLSIIPGTSRSGATIIGALVIGVSRVAAAEFTFFLAVPVMFGLSFIKIIKFGFSYNTTEIAILTIGVVVAFFVSVLVIKFLMGYIRKHDFKLFGWYRIIIGVILFAYFIMIK